MNRLLNRTLLLALVGIFLLRAANHGDVAAAGAATPLPLGKPLYKIAVDEDGIYEITYAMLTAAGMNPAGVNPNTFEMLNRGEAVAYELQHDGDNQFEAGERLLFYGWRFDTSRYERMYVGDNIYWLWAGGSPTAIATIANPLRNAPITQGTRVHVTDPELRHSITLKDDWESEPNEADAWFWKLMTNGGTPQTHEFEVDLAHPVNSGTAQMIVELVGYNPQPNHRVSAQINSHPASGQLVFHNRQSRNIEQDIAASALVDGINDVDVMMESFSSDRILLNSITIVYTRDWIADNDEILFEHDAAGAHDFRVQGFSESVPAQIRLWDVSNRLQPEALTVSAAHVIDDGGSYSYRLGVNQSAADGRYLATTLSNVRQPKQIEEVVASSLTPPGNSAQWLAISYGDYLGQIERLAEHRRSVSKLSAHVVNVEDVINQYGYGFPLPQALHDFISDGYFNWSTDYVLLAGAASYNARLLDCGNCYLPDVHQVPAEMLFVDRFAGLVPTDFAYSLISGNDLIPEVAIGRLPLETVDEIENAVDKILQFEADGRNGASGHANLLFGADNLDGGGDFCSGVNSLIADYTISAFNNEVYCLDDYQVGAEDVDIHGPQLGSDMIDYANDQGALIMNYRGHGDIDHWGEDQYGIMWNEDIPSWQNAGSPLITMSADCLDSNYAWLFLDSFGTALLAAGDKRGSAAHWGSVGLGFDDEHDVLHRGFYEALIDLDIRRIGDAINYSKKAYDNIGYWHSELYTFALLGDPAMPVLPIAGETGAIAGPLALPYLQTGDGPRGGRVTYELEIVNKGTMVDTFTVSGSGAARMTASVGPLAPGASQTIFVSVDIPASATVGEQIDATVSVTSQADPLSDYDARLETTVNSTPTVVVLQAGATQTAASALTPLLACLLLLLTAIALYNRSVTFSEIIMSGNGQRL